MDFSREMPFVGMDHHISSSSTCNQSYWLQAIQHGIAIPAFQHGIALQLALLHGAGKFPPRHPANQLGT